MRTVILLAILAPACQKDHTFHTTAVYEAPARHCAMRIEAQGRVRGGADLSAQSSAIVTFEPIVPHPSAAARVSLPAALEQGQVQIGDDTRPQGSPPAARREALSARLIGAGCAPVPEEVDELVSAIEGALLGPKATLMEGQTKVLSVGSTSFGC